MDEQKKRLVDLIEAGIDRVEDLADYLLEHGVLVPPCKVGDTLWWCVTNEDSKLFDGDPGAGVYEEPKGVQAVVWDGESFGVVIDGDIDPIGDQYAQLTREDAQKWLEENKEA